MTDPAGIALEGRQWIFEDVDPRTTLGGSVARRSGRYVRCQVTRNRSGFALLPKRVVAIDTVDAGYPAGMAAGYTQVTADPNSIGVVDEYLPAAGVPDKDLFWMVVEGPTLCKTDLAGGATNVFSVGTRVVALTAATSGATTAGRIAPQDLTGATSVLGNQIINCIGKAMTAKTTAQTDNDILIDCIVDMV